ncbi:MAG: hypothetical protein EXR36_12060 [Betaproteobacteria bacterium]|nr:hypothetical protein [Betaproteobacteria bacterium]
MKKRFGALSRQAIAGFIAALLSCAAAAHDFITAETAEKYLAQATGHSQTLKSSASAREKAQSAYQLGRMLDEIREFLNRDIAAHGSVQGLASNRLVAELKARGTPLAQDSKGRYLANLNYYRDALKYAPHGARESEALYRLVQGYFYDSFEDDPLKPQGQSWVQLEEQIALAERLLGRFAQQADLGEAYFILLIHYVQAARFAPEGAKMSYAAKAHAAISAFQSRYPDSLRAAAMPVMLEALR